MSAYLVKTRGLAATDRKPQRIKATHPNGSTWQEGYHVAGSEAVGVERHAEVVTALVCRVECVDSWSEFSFTVTHVSSTTDGMTFKVERKKARA